MTGREGITERTEGSETTERGFSDLRVSVGSVVQYSPSTLHEATQEVSQMADNKHNWPDLIKKLPGWITGFIAFVTAVVGFVKLWQGDTSLVTIVLLTMVDQRPLLAAAGGGAVKSVGGQVAGPV